MYQHPDCCKYGCSADLANNTVNHAPACPQNPANILPKTRTLEPLICRYCDHRFLVGSDHVEHEANCPAKPVLGDNVKSLALARIDTGKAQWPDDCPAMSALDMARDWVRKSGKNPDHVIVFLGKQTEDGADGVKFFQTGTYRSYAQVGMVHAGLDAMNQSGFAGYDE
jgi:hypothetical protein